jgi:hypothetical protein
MLNILCSHIVLHMNRSRSVQTMDPEDPANSARQLSTYNVYLRTMPLIDFTTLPAYLELANRIPPNHVDDMARLQLGCLPILWLCADMHALLFLFFVVLVLVVVFLK